MITQKCVQLVWKFAKSPTYLFPLFIGVIGTLQVTQYIEN